MKTQGYKTAQMGTIGTLTVIFFILKITGAISWSWWWVFSPLWLPTVGILTFMAVSAAFILLCTIIVETYRKYFRK